MTKIEIGELKKAVKSPKQTSIIVFFNYLINPFLLFGLGYLFFEVLFPSFGLIDLVTARYLWTGLILLGVAPCIAMVLVWTDLCKGNGPLGIVLMAWNSIITNNHHAAIHRSTSWHLCRHQHNHNRRKHPTLSWSATTPRGYHTKASYQTQITRMV